MNLKNELLKLTKITEPIEGFFIKSKDDLIFDVKGLTHPVDRFIAFVRYVSDKYFENEKENSFKKLYAFQDRYNFLTKYYPKYIFSDPKGRGLLQAVHKNDLSEIYNPINKLKTIISKSKSELDPLELRVKEFVNELLVFCKIPIENIGISGSILVGLHNNQSDIDLVIYGIKEGEKIYNSLSELFEKSAKIQRYNESELERLWKTRGQTKQIDFKSFFEMEKNKHLQGTFNGSEFYIRLIPFPEEFNEHYKDVTITSFGEIEIKAKIENDTNSIFTPNIYYLKEVSIIDQESSEVFIPERIFTLRGRYCELAKQNNNIHVRGKLEKVEFRNKKTFFQIVLGTSSTEYFKKIHL